VKTTCLCILVVLISGCSALQGPPISATSLVLQGVRFYFSLAVPSEIPVEATGTGLTREKAIDNALISAVQQAIGVLVVSDVTVDSNRVVRDIAINYASGVVKEYSIKQCNESVRVQCTIRAKVSPALFQQKLLASSSVTKIDGENMYGQYLTSRNAIIQRYRITEYFLSRIRTQGLQVQLRRFEVQPTAKNKVPIYIQYSIRFIPSYKKTIINLFEQLQKDTGAGFNPWTGRRGEPAIGVNPYTIYIQWGPTNFNQNQAWIHTYDYNYAQMIRKYEYENIPIMLKELGICENINVDSVFIIDWRGLTRSGTIYVDPEKLKGVKQLTIELGC